MTSRVLQDAIVRLLQQRPFYGHMLLNFHRQAGNGDKALGVTIAHGVPTLQVNEERFAAYAAEEQSALLEHVLKHVLHLHMARRKERNSHDWDVACDLAINPSIPNLPAGAPFPRFFKMEDGLAAEEYYQQLHRLFDTGNLEGGGYGNASPDQGEHRDEAETAEVEVDLAEVHRPEPLDDHQIWQEADSTPLGLAEQMVRSMVRDAHRKCGDEVPGDLRGLIDGLLAPPAIPWRQILRQFVATAGRVGRKTTWKREHRRFGQETPGIRKRQRLNLLVGVDVSDSTDQRQLRELFARELGQIARGRDSLITVLYAGSRIQKIEAFRSNHHVAEVYHGGGFTDLRPVFDYARQMQPRPAAVIYLTDGFGPAPEQMEFPTLWVLTADGEKPVPWGVELRLNNQPDTRN